MLKGFLECRLNRLFGAFLAGEVFEFYNVREPGFSAGRFDHKVDVAGVGAASRFNLAVNAVVLGEVERR